MATISPMAPINPQISFWDRLGLLGGGMAQNNVLGAMAQMQNMQQNMLQLRLQQEQQVLAERRRQQALNLEIQQQVAEQQRRARLAALAPRMFPDDPNMQALAVADPESVGQMYMSQQPKPVTPTTAERLYDAMVARGATDKPFGEWYAEDFRPGAASTTTVNVGQTEISSGEAESYASTETLLDSLGTLDTLLEGGVDLSGISGLWTEIRGTPDAAGAIANFLDRLTPKESSAFRLAKRIQNQAGRLMQSGVLSDQDIARVEEALGLIGGTDPKQAVKELLDVFEGQYMRRRQMRGQPMQTGDVKVLSIRRLPD